MIHLPFKGNFDFIYSTFDSINYIHNDRQLIEFFKGIKNIISDDSFFIFDVSLKHNSLKHLKRLNRNGKYAGIEYKQISEFDEKTGLHINTVIIKTSGGKIYKERHIQKIYDFYYYFHVLEKADLYIVECLEAFSFKDGTPDSERLQFIVKRKT